MTRSDSLEKNSAITFGGIQLKKILIESQWTMDVVPPQYQRKRAEDDLITQDEDSYCNCGCCG